MDEEKRFYEKLDVEWKEYLSKSIQEKKNDNGSKSKDKRFFVKYDLLEEYSDKLVLKYGNKEKIQRYLNSEKDKDINRNIINITNPFALAFWGFMINPMFSILAFYEEGFFLIKVLMIIIILFIFLYYFLKLVQDIANKHYENNAKESAYKFVLSKIKDQ